MIFEIVKAPNCKKNIFTEKFLGIGASKEEKSSK